MGGSVVLFDKNAGINYTRNKKRMRGDIIKGPEIKKWNCFNGGNSYSSFDFVNLVYVNTPTYGCYKPFQLVWPSNGTTQASRVGARINFLGFRLKGWITLSPTQLKMMRWRLVLARLDMPNGSYTFESAAYLGQFSNSNTTFPSSTFNVDEYDSFCRHNFYKKFKDVDNKTFKTKVIASGCLPATNEYKKMYINLTGTVNGSAATLGSNPAANNYVMGLHTGNVGYIPIDVKVRLNDTIDCVQNMRRYFIVLETDCGYGWNDAGVAGVGNVGFLVNAYCRGYFTDA